MTVQNLAGYVEASAARWPDRAAVVDPAGWSVTYAELDRQADALARSLAARGVQRGDRVGVVLPKSVAAVVAIIAAMKAGAAYVPVDFTAPLERGRRILADCQVRAVIVDSRALAVVPDVVENPLAAVIVVGPLAGNPPTTMTSWEAALAGAGPAVADAARPTDLAYILYTSGSTGIPKGVMITHANALTFAECASSVFAPEPDDRFSSHAPFHFDFAVLDIFVALKHGATLYLISEDLAKRPRELARFMAAHRLTVWASTPSILTLLLQFGDLSSHDMSSLRLVVFGGEVFPVKHLRALQRQWPAPTYVNVYGPTETTVFITFARIPPVIPDERDTPYPIGFPCAHCQTLVLDDDGREVAPGAEGYLYASGPSVFMGYWNRPLENAAVFLERAGVRWYNTGDVVRWDPDEGYIYVGRKDGMVKRRGYRIELGEIERALYLHPQVREAAVVAIPDADSGVKIVAFLSCHEGETPSVIELKAFCASQAPAYMNPDRFVIQDELPRTSTDKVDYQALRRDLVDRGAAARAELQVCGP